MIDWVIGVSMARIAFRPVSQTKNQLILSFYSEFWNFFGDEIRIPSEE